MKENAFSTQQTIDEIQFITRIPKSRKTKLIKELNHKSNLTLQDGKQYTSTKFNTGENIDVLIGKSRFRPDVSCSTYSEENLNISRANSKNKYSKTTKLDGKVQFSDDNGNQFMGTYHNGIRVSGKMVYCKAKCQYEGSFLGQRFHGHGKLTYFNGRTIEGQWEQHFLIGNAIVNYPNGDVYYGGVNRKLHRHGKGHLFLNNGDKYIGDFMDGSITGYGILYKLDSIIEGHWMQGQLIKEIKSNQSQDEQSNDGGTIKRLEYLQSQTNFFNNDSKHVHESLISPSSSNIRLIAQKSTKNKDLRESDVSNDGLNKFSRTGKV